jgi:calcineurin-like phosphoesterase
MRILFLGDVVGSSGCSKLVQDLPSQKKQRKIDFVIVNGENADESGVGLTEKICEKFFSSGVDVITSGNHIWDQRDIMKVIDNEKRILRPKNFFEPSPGKGFEIFTTINNFKVGVLNLIGNVYMKKSNDVFETANQFISKSTIFLYDFSSMC